MTTHVFGSKTTVDQKRKWYTIVMRILEMKNKGVTIEVLEIPEISEALLAIPKENI